MNEKTRQKIYHHLDESGFKFKKTSVALSGFIDSLSGEVQHNEPYDLILPILNEFSLDEWEVEKLIIDYVFDTTGVRIQQIQDLTSLSSINGLPFFILVNEEVRDSSFFTLAFKTIKGSFIVRPQYKIKSLGNIEQIDGNLGVDNCYLRSFGSLRRVNGNFWIAGNALSTSITTLSPLEYVGRDLKLVGSNIHELGTLRYVGGSLDLRETPINNLGQLKKVGWNLYLPSEVKNQIDLSKIHINGKTKYFKKAVMES